VSDWGHSRRCPLQAPVYDLPLFPRKRRSAVNKIKHCRGFATRYDKLAANDLTFIKLVSIRIWLERDANSLNHCPALAFCLRMICSENRFPLFGIML